MKIEIKITNDSEEKYKARYIPGKGIVRVPTYIYFKMLQAEAAKQDLEIAKQKHKRQELKELYSLISTN